MEKELLFSVTKDDLEIQTFRSGGKGGQNQNKRDTGVRIIHRESGAVGEARDEREQGQNKKLAFNRMAASPKFKIWLNKKANEIISGETVEQKVDRMMSPANLKIEVQEDGKWTKEKADDKT